MKHTAEYEASMELKRKAINHRLEELVGNNNMSDQLFQFVKGGKKLRGCLCMLVAESLGLPQIEVECYETSLDLACVVELSHAMSLIVDDAIDEDTTRRGKPTLHKLVGYKKTMLHAIYGLTYPYELTVRQGERFVEPFIVVMRGMTAGALWEFKQTLKEMSKRRLPATSIYDSIITKKTGLLF